MGTINARLDKLEQQRGTEDQRRLQIEADAAEFRARLENLAATMKASSDPDVVDPAARGRFDAFMARFRAETARLA